MPAIAFQDITGIVLAGGRGSRMGGVDKGLQRHGGLALAGFLAGLDHCVTDTLVTVPCDSPNFPLDLVARLSAAMTSEAADVAIATTLEGGAVQPQPVFCLMRTVLRDSLLAFVQSGQRKIDRWTGNHGCAMVLFDDVTAFANANTLAELQGLQRS